MCVMQIVNRVFYLSAAISYSCMYRIYCDASSQGISGRTSSHSLLHSFWLRSRLQDELSVILYHGDGTRRSHHTPHQSYIQNGSSEDAIRIDAQFIRGHKNVRLSHYTAIYLIFFPSRDDNLCTRKVEGPICVAGSLRSGFPGMDII